MNEIFRPGRKADRRRGLVQARARSVCPVREKAGDRDAGLSMPLLGADDRGSFTPAMQSHDLSGSELDRLHEALGHVTPESNPRTAKLLGSGTRKTAQKVIEEAGEVALEGIKHRPLGVVRESADLLYHLVVLWRRAGVDPAEVWMEMRRRADAFGIAEKLPKPQRRNSLAPHAER